MCLVRHFVDHPRNEVQQLFDSVLAQFRNTALLYRPPSSPSLGTLNYSMFYGGGGATNTEENMFYFIIHRWIVWFLPPLAPFNCCKRYGLLPCCLVTVVGTPKIIMIKCGEEANAVLSIAYSY